MIGPVERSALQWMLLPFKRYARTSGRSQRQEYWMFVLFTVLGNIALGIVDELFGLKLPGSDGSFGDNGILGLGFSFATLVPSITVAVRRLHDTDRSGWWLWFPIAVVVAGVFALGGYGVYSDGGDDFTAGVLAFVVLGFIVASVGGLIVLLCLDGTRGANRFGDDPKGVSYEGVFD